MTNPRVLAEDWLPMAALGIESRRERGAASALPPLSFLHIWWARRPLVASAGVVLAGLLPGWTPRLAARYPGSPQVACEASYRAWLLHLTGIWGDPVAARRALDLANAEGRRVDGNGYGYKQAFRNQPDRGELDFLRQVVSDTWGEDPLVADVTAGGGSIPFASARLGLNTYANDLNGVAATLLSSGVKFAAEYGADLLPDVEKWGRVFVGRVQARIKPFFPQPNNETTIAYIWANTVACPRTGKLVPLVNDWSLRVGSSSPVAIRLITERSGLQLDGPEFELCRGSQIDFDPTLGLVGRGSALSPWDDNVIDGDYIKKEGQSGRLGAMLYAVATKRADGTRGFRLPNAQDLRAAEQAAEELTRLRSALEASWCIPTEAIPIGNDVRVAIYGVDTYAKMFTDRQLLVHATFA